MVDISRRGIAVWQAVRSRVTEKRAIAGSAAVGVVALLLGALLIAKNANSYDGSPLGWFFVLIGIVGVLTVVAIHAGAYRE